MIESQKIIDKIIEIFNIYISEVKLKSACNLNDESIHAENFICELLNMCYGYKLHNLNEDKLNFPGIDLGDEENRLGIQVTMQKNSDKINDTLKKCCENKCYKTYDNIKFFIIPGKQGSYKIKYDYNGKLNFNIDSDILDFEILCKKINYLKLEQQEKLYEYLCKQISKVNFKFCDYEFIWKPDNPIRSSKKLKLVNEYKKTYKAKFIDFKMEIVPQEMVDGVEALTQNIIFFVNTERNKYEIYSSDYGNDCELFAVNNDEEFNRQSCNLAEHLIDYYGEWIEKIYCISRKNNYLIIEIKVNGIGETIFVNVPNLRCK